MITIPSQYKLHTLLISAATVLLTLSALTGLGVAQSDEADHSEPGHAEHSHAHADQPSDDGHAHSLDQSHGNLIELTPAERTEFGVELQTAELGAIDAAIELLGEVTFNPDDLAHLTPRVPGVVREVYHSIGDRVQANEVLGVLDSRELAQAKSSYLAAQSRLELARSNFERARRLREQQITSEAAFLEAEQARREAEVDRQLAARELYALGLTREQINRIPNQPANELTGYRLQAPIAGTITQRHLTRGEIILSQPEDPAFVIGNTGSVWVELTVYPRHLERVRPGQPVSIAADQSALSVRGQIDHVSPQLNPSTRSATARVVLPNENHQWRPGQFVTARVLTERSEDVVVVPESAVQRVEGRDVIYVQRDGGFEPRVVQLGRRSEGQAEVARGLEPGERFAATRTFTLKAEQSRSVLEHAGHSH